MYGLVQRLSTVLQYAVFINKIKHNKARYKILKLNFFQHCNNIILNTNIIRVYSIYM